MEKITATVTNVTVISDSTYPVVELELSAPIDGMINSRVDGKWTTEAGKVTKITINPSKLERNLRDVSETIAEFRSIIAQSFTRREFGAILHKATISVIPTLHKEGDIIEGFVDADGSFRSYSRDCFGYEIVDIHLTKRNLEMMDKLMFL